MNLEVYLVSHDWVKEYNASYNKNPDNIRTPFLRESPAMLCSSTLSGTMQNKNLSWDGSFSSSNFTS